MPEPRYFRPNQSEVAAEIIDNEVIIIRLTDGVYYSMEGVGVLVWRLLEAGCSLDDMAREISEACAVDADRVSDDLNKLTDSLQKERLIIAGDGAQKGAASNGDATQAHADLPQYAKPTLRIYEDMNDLLALDPPSPGHRQFDSSDASD